MDLRRKDRIGVGMDVLLKDLRLEDKQKQGNVMKVEDLHQPDLSDDNQKRRVLITAYGFQE